MVTNPALKSACTTRFVNPTTALMAAHCLRLDKSEGKMNVEGVDSLAYFTLAGYPGDRSQDIAVVVFPEGTGEFLGIRTYPPLASSTQERGRAFVVGYGREHEFASPGQDGGGVKGWGELELVGRREGLLQTRGMKLIRGKPFDEGKGKHVVGLAGDSGAAVFSEKGEIVALLTRRIVDTVSKLVELPRFDDLSDFYPSHYEPILTKDPIGIHNELVDVTSATSHSLFLRAVLCESYPCAGNFPGSGVPASAAAWHTQSAPSRDNRFFTHRTLRTGRYHWDLGSEDAFVTTYYRANRIAKVEMRAFDGVDDISPPITFTCREARCETSLPGITLDIDDNDTFLFSADIGHGAQLNRYRWTGE